MDLNAPLGRTPPPPPSAAVAAHGLDRLRARWQAVHARWRRRLSRDHGSAWRRALCRRLDPAAGSEAVATGGCGGVPLDPVSDRLDRAAGDIEPRKPRRFRQAPSGPAVQTGQPERSADHRRRQGAGRPWASSRRPQSSCFAFGPTGLEPPQPEKAPVRGRSVAIFVGGMGLSSAATKTATELMPSAVAFAFVPYGDTVAAAVAAAKARGHEILLLVPMQNAGASAPGPHALRPGEPVNRGRRRRRLADGPARRLRRRHQPARCPRHRGSGR